MTDQFFDTAAELGSEEEDEDFDEETGAPRKGKTNGLDMVDSSEEEEEDDEERLAEEGAGFVVDEDEEEEVEDRAARRRRRKRKNREIEALDEEDLDLIGAEVERPEQTQSKYKRLKRGHKERREAKSRGVDDIFSDDDAAEEDVYSGQHGGDEFADFIEEEHFEDDIEDDREVGQPGMSILTSGLQAAGLTEGAEDDYRSAFGDGTDYAWAIDLQDQQDYEEEGDGRELQLKDVFEPAQLAERLLTDEDNEIREKDVPERIQLARKPFKELDLSQPALDTRLNEEATWVTQLLWPKKALPQYFHKPFLKAVRQVLHFINVDDYEVPFIFNHRKDYLIHSPKDDDENADDFPGEDRPERLLNQSDLWEVFDLDLKFRAFAEKRDALRTHYDNLRHYAPDITDNVIEELTSKAVTIEEIQELQDYLHFQYSAELKDVREAEDQRQKDHQRRKEQQRQNGEAEEQEAEEQDAEKQNSEKQNGTQKRANNARSFYDRIRGTSAYSFVHAIGIKPDDVAKAAENNLPPIIEDPPVTPDELAESLIQNQDQTAPSVLRSAKLMYIQELITSPRLRKHVRETFYKIGHIDCIRTEKGLRKITEDHPYMEFKYLRRQTYLDLAGRPDMFLRMLKAEEEGLINVKIQIDGYERWKEKMKTYIMNTDVSERAQSWNALRSEMLGTALDKMQATIANGVKESLRAKCEDEYASRARENFANRLDQAPFKPRGAVIGSIPNVIAMSNGKGGRGDAICWAYVENDGRVLENDKLVDFRLGNKDRNIPNGKDVEKFVEVLRRRKPDVIGISGFSVETRRLYKDLQKVIDEFNIMGNPYDDDDGKERTDPLEVIMVNDEVARLYHKSQRAANEFPKFPTMTRYCVALARYLQNPLAEYAQLGKDVVSIPFVPDQTLIPQEKLLDRLENAMVDIVNLVGIDVMEAYDDVYLSKLLPYICGLGPRKADKLIKTIRANGDEMTARYELMGLDLTESRDLKPAMGPKVYENAASFLYFQWEDHSESSDYLDNTRVHPEDYDLARKMVADAMNLDEEDVKAEVDADGPSAVVHRMVRDELNELLEDLALDAYAEEIEEKIGSRKRATLETIRAELADPYEELRQHFAMPTGDDIFTMLTGETKESLTEKMVVPVQIKRTFPDHIEVKLECGIEGSISEAEFPAGVGAGMQEPRHVYQPHQTVQAKIMHIDRKGLSAHLSLRPEVIRDPMPPRFQRVPGEWDDEQEAADKKAAEREKEVASGRPNRVVNHPLFFQFNSAQAEEYLGSKEPGEVVIRPSSKGLDHLAVTWKVGDNSYQHIDVLELGKKNEYSLGTTLKVGKYSYSDLDELIVNHVEAMAKKVTELTKDERYKEEGKQFTENWLAQYCIANPTRFMYAFCATPKYPGYFSICYQAGEKGPKGAWPIKIVPNAFELQGNGYPDVASLKNGFKMLYQSRHPPGGRPPARR